MHFEFILRRDLYHNFSLGIQGSRPSLAIGTRSFRADLGRAQLNLVYHINTIKRSEIQKQSPVLSSRNCVHILGNSKMAILHTLLPSRLFSFTKTFHISVLSRPFSHRGIVPSIGSNTWGLHRVTLGKILNAKPTGIDAIGGRLSANGQIRGMKTRSSVKRLCDGCKVCVFRPVLFWEHQALRQTFIFYSSNMSNLFFTL